MSETKRDMPDWALPAILVGVAVVVGVIGWTASAVVGGGSGDAPDVVRSLERYTECLARHGADVPIVDARRDGGFAVIVPGSLLDDGVDRGALLDAHQMCTDEAGALIEDALQSVGAGFAGELLGGSWMDMLGSLDQDSFSGPHAFGDPPPVTRLPGHPNRMVPPGPDRIDELCERLNDGSLDLDRQTQKQLERRCKAAGA